MGKLNKEEFKKNVIENLKILYRKSIAEATPQQIYQAVSYAVKDMVIDRWILSIHGIPHWTFLRK